MTALEVENLIDAFRCPVIERAMGAEMNVHLGYRPGEDKLAELTDECNSAGHQDAATPYTGFSAGAGAA